MHGGISPDLQYLNQIESVKRFREIPLEGMMCDLMWADPMKDDDATHGQWMFNDSRECSHFFGKKPLKELLKNNHLLSVFRGH